MSKNRQKYISFFILILLIIPVSSFSAQNESSDEKNLENYLKYFYNRYGQHFNDFGLKYSSPTYGVENFKNPVTAREWISLASYYKYRDDEKSKDIIHDAIIEAYREISSRPAYTQSFNDAEALFLIIRLIEKDQNILSYIEKERIFDLMTYYLEQGINAKDTENRAIIAGTHWQYITDYLYSKKRIINKEHFDKLIKEKINKAIQNSINIDGWYFEEEMKSFTPHYHVVTAFMLMVYGDITNQKDYINLAEKMYFNIKKISFINGMVEAKLGHRPVGLGAQFYLMQGLLGKYFNDDDYKVYLFYASGNRFFSDKQHPNRLEFHSTLEFTKPNYHDDYAFSDAAELSLIIDRLKNINLYYKHYFDEPIQSSNDKYFKIKNFNNKIFINNKINLLGSYGNWSQLFYN